MIEKKKRLRMIWDISDDLKMRVKLAAVKRNITMSMLMERAIVAYLNNEERFEKKP